MDFRGFAPHNSIKSTDIPDFRQRNKQHDLHPSANHQLELLQTGVSTPESNFGQGKTLSELGDSSSIFSYNNTPTSFDFEYNPTQTSAKSPIPLLFGTGKASRTADRPISKRISRTLRDSSPIYISSSPPSVDFGSKKIETNSDYPSPDTRSHPQKNKMVNERSPAKSPLRPVVPNDQSQMESQAIKPGSSVPQFGQISVPQSPLFRAQPKEKSVFIQPKARPEHHREPSMFYFQQYTSFANNLDV